MLFISLLWIQLKIPLLLSCFSLLWSAPWMSALLEQVCLAFQLDLNSRICSGWYPVSRGWLEWWILDWSDFCRQSEWFGVCALEDEDQLLLRVSSPLSSRSFKTPPKFGCSSSQMGFKLCSALLVWLVLEGPVESWHHGLSSLMTELLHSRGNPAMNLHLEFASTHMLSLRWGWSRKVQLPFEGGVLTLVVWEHSRAAAEVDCALEKWSWSGWWAVSGMIFSTEELPGEGWPLNFRELCAL